MLEPRSGFWGYRGTEKELGVVEKKSERKRYFLFLSLLFLYLGLFSLFLVLLSLFPGLIAHKSDDYRGLQDEDGLVARARPSSTPQQPAGNGM